MATKRTVDVTPSWSAMMPALISMLIDGTPEAKNIAIEELARLARLMDQVIAQNKAGA